MRYVRSILQPGERILARGRFHWIIYADAVLALLVGVLLMAASSSLPLETSNTVIPPLVSVSEIAATNFRVIRKSGFIRRKTWEMNMDKVESVTVDQSILGRILGYGTIHVLGTGEGVEHLHQIRSPIELRNRIVAR